MSVNPHCGTCGGIGEIEGRPGTFDAPRIDCPECGPAARKTARGCALPRQRLTELMHTGLAFSHVREPDAMSIHDAALLTRALLEP